MESDRVLCVLRILLLPRKLFSIIKMQAALLERDIVDVQIEAGGKKTRVLSIAIVARGQSFPRVAYRTFVIPGGVDHRVISPQLRYDSSSALISRFQ